MNLLYEFDKSYGKLIAGIDEAGRGPLAGPVVAAAVVVKNHDMLLEVNDSKKISEKKREKLYNVIMENCDVGIGIIDHKRVDEVNILNATFEAMNMAVCNLKTNYDIILVDGNQRVKGLKLLHETIVKGDGKSLAIAAASIIAKVTRDRIMTDLALQYSEYGFEKHKGYGTAFHIERLKEFGSCEIHRHSFIKGIMNKGV